MASPPIAGALVGQTTDGRPVYAGLFRFYDTYGLPLEDVFTAVRDRGGMVAWPTFYAEARQAGWRDQRIRARLSEAIAEVWGADVRDVVLRRLGAGRR